MFEELVFAEVEAAFQAADARNFGRKEKQNDICTCRQCRLDVACYVLNRLEPHYVVSSRGILRDEYFDMDKRQKMADIASLIYRGIKQVNLNRRPGFKHTREDEQVSQTAAAYFNIPVIIGNLFNGSTFEPVSDMAVELYMDGQLAVMKNANWQNPCNLVKKTEGKFTFWPASVPSGHAGEQKLFNFSVKVPQAELPPLVYYFELPVVSENESVNTLTMNRTHKISDLYLFDRADAYED
jgi:competence protein ComFB